MVIFHSYVNVYQRVSWVLWTIAGMSNFQAGAGRETWTWSRVSLWRTCLSTRTWQTGRAVAANRLMMTLRSMVTPELPKPKCRMFATSRMYMYLRVFVCTYNMYSIYMYMKWHIHLLYIYIEIHKNHIYKMYISISICFIYVSYISDILYSCGRVP